MQMFDDIPEQYPWYAVKVRTSAESRLQAALAEKGYPVFLPTYLDCRQYSDRVRKVHSALFPGYLFCRFDAERRLPILTTPGVYSIVGLGGLPQAIEEEEITAIQRVVQSDVNAVPWPYLRTGDPVEIRYGAFAGLRGLLVSVRGRDRLVLSIHLLQRSVSIEIDRTWIRPSVFPAAIPAGIATKTMAASA